MKIETSEDAKQQTRGSSIGGFIILLTIGFLGGYFAYGGWSGAMFGALTGLLIYLALLLALIPIGGVILYWWIISQYIFPKLLEYTGYQWNLLTTGMFWFGGILAVIINIIVCLILLVILVGSR